MVFEFCSEMLLAFEMYTTFIKRIRVKPDRGCLEIMANVKSTKDLKKKKNQDICARLVCTLQKEV